MSGLQMRLDDGGGSSSAESSERWIQGFATPGDLINAGIEFAGDATSDPVQTATEVQETAEEAAADPVGTVQDATGGLDTSVDVQEMGIDGRTVAIAAALVIGAAYLRRRS